MSKFVRGEKRSTSNASSDASEETSVYLKYGTPEGKKTLTASSVNSQSSSIPVYNRNVGEDQMIHGFEVNPDLPGPETPAMQSSSHRLKRLQVDCLDVSEKHSFRLAESTKRMKSLREPDAGGKGRMNSNLQPETGSSKFEWLNPSHIKDANGRRPSHPQYDKRTLYIPPAALSQMSATQRQYWDVKRQYMDIVLFFKVGKFYELYELDAEIGQKELDWKMTHSGVGKCRQVGISESGIDDAVQKLIARGYKVGRIEQLETSDQAKARGASSVIQRKLVHVSCPSTMTDVSIGPDALHLLVLKEVSVNNSRMYGFAFLDCATLKFWVGCVRDDVSYSALGALFVQVSPKEVVYESEGLSKETLKAMKKYASTGSSSMQFTPTPSTDFLDAFQVRNLIISKGYFKDSFDHWARMIDCDSHLNLALCALGGLIVHLSRLKLDDALHNGDLLPYHVYKGCLKMDGQTLVNLEIFSNNIDGGSSGTLYKHLDHCATSFGKRLLRRWICNPLKSIEEINDRLNVVEGLVSSPGICSVILEHLRRVPDLERLCGHVKAFGGSSTLLLLPALGERTLKRQVKSFGMLLKGLRIGLELLRLLEEENNKALPLVKVLNIPMVTDLDECLKQFEVSMEEVFPEYKDDKVKITDSETLSALVKPFVGKMSKWSQVIQSLSRIDVLQSFAVAACMSGGIVSRPILVPASSGSPILKIRGLWHPYAVGQNGGSFVPNDLFLGEDSTGCHPRTLLLTGPNMGGKSTLLRATCLSVVLAQLGSFVPCDSLILSPVDIIFTRLGAMDRIMSGESTFFIECAETASVLHNATENSLVLLDELGRGTSTFDGYAIAYAVFRHLVEKVNCRLLFSTHYHPLTKEFATHPHVSLQHMACAFRPSSTSERDDLVFLYRLTPGACPESYGLQVALMAGIPPQVVDLASKARERIRVRIADNFRSSEGRQFFSSYHEDCLKTLLEVSRCYDGLDEDAFDTMICLWHELKSSNGSVIPGHAV